MTQKEIIEWVKSLAQACAAAGIVFDSERVLAYVGIAFVILAGANALRAKIKRTEAKAVK